MVSSMGTRIKNLRLQKGYSQQELAQMLGVPKGIVSKYENNERNPSYENLIKLADIFQVTTDFLLGRKRSERDTLVINIHDWPLKRIELLTKIIALIESL